MRRADTLLLWSPEPQYLFAAIHMALLQSQRPLSSLIRFKHTPQKQSIRNIGRSELQPRLAGERAVLD
jgi:hypothetical protein